MLVLLFFGFVNAFAADGDGCTAITSVPTTITKAGVYCLKADLSFSSTSGNAVTVASDDVTIDLGAHTLDNLGSGTQTTGVGTSGSRSNITVQNGTVSGFGTGVKLAGSGALVENIRAASNSAGIDVSGTGAIVRNNQIVSSYVGIVMTGNGSRALNNDVAEFTGYGINPYTSSGMVVEGNRFSASKTAPLSAYGIYITGGNLLVVNNRVLEEPKGAPGLFVSNSAVVVIRDNIFSGCTHGDQGTTITDLGNDQCIP